MVVRSPIGGYGELFRRPPMPTPVRITVLLFALLAALFALATVHRLIAEGGSLGAAAFFATMAGGGVLVTVSLVGRRPWAVYPAYTLAALLAVASLGLFGAITIVGVTLLVWVLWALNTRTAQEWLRRGRRR